MRKAPRANEGRRITLSDVCDSALRVALSSTCVNAEAA